MIAYQEESEAQNQVDYRQKIYPQRLVVPTGLLTEKTAVTRQGSK
jgi:hypothetical protein